MLISPAAIRFEKRGQADLILQAVARHLAGNNVGIEGYFQHNVNAGEDRRTDLWLEDISTGEKLRISQALGPGSKGCRLDPQALAEACGRMEKRLHSGTELLILNRFGKDEFDGRGMRSVIVRAMEMQVPVLVAVSDLYFDGWLEFCGSEFVNLPPNQEAVLNWAKTAIEWIRAERMVA
ncbi:MAG: DUF2478 domain-containing protein [Rhizobiaceae bacterium]